MPSHERGGGAANRQSPWPLFLTVHATLIGHIEARLRQAGLPEIAWYDALWALERAPDARLRMHELADSVVITRTNLTRLVDRLETAGLVARAPDSDDRRGSYAVLTPAGRAMRRRIWPVYGRAIDELFDIHLKGVERRLMSRALTRILRAARSGTAKP
ncbi:MAG: MarR family winged helix-turn-helix transcriptional regulator [Hyphomicrobiaceae bacterium]